MEYINNQKGKRKREISKYKKSYCSLTLSLFHWMYISVHFSLTASFAAVFSLSSGLIKRGTFVKKTSFPFDPFSQVPFSIHSFAVPWNFNHCCQKVWTRILLAYECFAYYYYLICLCSFSLSLKLKFSLHFSSRSIYYLINYFNGLHEFVTCEK